MFVCYECCVLSGRGLCDELITRPEESYRQHCVVVCDREVSLMWRQLLFHSYIIMHHSPLPGSLKQHFRGIHKP